MKNISFKCFLYVRNIGCLLPNFVLCNVVRFLMKDKHGRNWHPAITHLLCLRLSASARYLDVVNTEPPFISFQSFKQSPCLLVYNILFSDFPMKQQKFVLSSCTRICFVCRHVENVFACLN